MINICICINMNMCLYVMYVPRGSDDSDRRVLGMGQETDLFQATV